MRLTIGLRCSHWSARPASVSATPATSESLQLVGRAARRLEPLAAPQPEDHRRERRDEAQRGPAAAVEAERLEAREEIEEPGVERPGDVRVLVEVREEARIEVRPVRRHADRRVVEIGRRQRIQDERRPEAHEDRGERDRLRAQRRERQQEQERVAEPDLRERVFEGPVGARPIQRAQEDPERDQRDAAPGRVREHPAERLPLAPGGWQSKTAAPRRRGTRTRAG